MLFCCSSPWKLPNGATMVYRSGSVLAYYRGRLSLAENYCSYSTVNPVVLNNYLEVHRWCDSKVVTPFGFHFLLHFATFSTIIFVINPAKCSSPLYRTNSIMTVLGSRWISLSHKLFCCLFTGDLENKAFNVKVGQETMFTIP